MPEPYPIIPKPTPTFYFIGVTTQQSSIMKIFPKWMKVLGKPEVVIEGVDLAIHARSEEYRKVVAQIKSDPNSLGALVTTHKVDLLHAARDLFDDLDPYAMMCEEVSSISKMNGRLQGHAKDPISSGLSLEAILGPGYFGNTGGLVLFFGAGGAATATILYLIRRPDPASKPKGIILVDRIQKRLDQVREMIEKAGSNIAMVYYLNEDPHQNDHRMAALPPKSLVVNATGMGKDIPGSPITNEGIFPFQGVVWEFNYRGDLDFLHQAWAQAQKRQLKVENGWLYFLHGWTQVIAQVLHIDLTPELFQRLKESAEG